MRKRIRPNVEVGIDSSLEANGVTFHVPTDARIVIPEIVVREVGVPVVVLPREPQREFESTCSCGIVVRRIVPERFTLIPPPHSRTGGIGDEPGCVQVTGLAIVRAYDAA